MKHEICCEAPLVFPNFSQQIHMGFFSMPSPMLPSDLISGNNFSILSTTTGWGVNRIAYSGTKHIGSVRLADWAVHHAGMVSTFYCWYEPQHLVHLPTVWNHGDSPAEHNAVFHFDSTELADESEVSFHWLFFVWICNNQPIWKQWFGQSWYHFSVLQKLFSPWFCVDNSWYNVSTRGLKLISLVSLNLKSLNEYILHQCLQVTI